MLGHQVVHEKRRPTFPLSAPDEFVALASDCWAPESVMRCGADGGRDDWLSRAAVERRACVIPVLGKAYFANNC